MPVKIEDLAEGYWWAKGLDGTDLIIEIRASHRAHERFKVLIMGVEQDSIVSDWLEHLIAPVAPYREKNTLIVMGWLGNKSAYLNVPREEAIARFNKDNEDDDEPDDIKEFEFTDELWVYDASGPYD